MSFLPTSLFLLPAGVATPSQWDCKGLLVPADYSAINGKVLVQGPAALKYHDLRRIRITNTGKVYNCPKSNRFLPPDHVEFASHEWTLEALLNWPRQIVEV